MIAFLLACLIVVPRPLVPRLLIRDGYVDPQGRRYPLAPGSFMMADTGVLYVLVSFTITAKTQPVLLVRPWNDGKPSASVVLPLSSFKNYEVRMLPGGSS